MKPDPVVALRPAATSQAEELRRLMADVVTRVIRDDVVRAETIDNVNGNVAFWLGHPERCVHLVATAGGSIVGVVLVKDFWNLCSLFVAPSHQGRGVGRALVEAAAAACRGRSPRQALWLNAATDAVGFYERLGFEPRASRQSLPPGFRAMQLGL